MPIHSIKPIRTEEDHSAAIEEIAALWNAEPGSPEHDRLEVLGILVDAYESARWPMDSPDPVEALKLHMEQHDLRQKDLEPAIGPASRVSEILRKKRRLTPTMIWNLHTRFHIPAECLVKPYELSRERACAGRKWLRT